MKKIKKFLAVFYIVFILAVVIWAVSISTVYSASKEDTYNSNFCKQQKGIKEYRINDPMTGKLQGRIDCLVTDYAIEVDFGKKYAECIGQALFYAMFSGRTPSCALITLPNSRFIKRAEALNSHYNLNIKFWTIAP